MPWPLTTVSASQCPASWRLYIDLSHLRIDFPLLYLPRISFTPWLFPFRRSTFMLPFTKHFSQIQRQMVRQLGSFSAQGVQAICSGDQVARSFSSM